MKFCRQPHCRLLNGAVFFFWGDPADYKRELATSFGKLIDLIEKPLTEQVTGDEFRARFTGDPKEKFGKFLKEEPFSGRAKFDLGSSTNEEIREGRILFMGSAPLVGGIAIPNFLYSELPAKLPNEEVETVFCEIFSTGLYSFAFADSVLACNPKTFPQSGAAAVKMLCEERLSAKCSDDTWLNPDYRRQLADTSQRLFDGPNRLTALSVDIVEDRLQQLDWETILPLWDRDVEDFFLIRADAAEDRIKLAAAIEPFVADLPKPRMFWKDRGWVEWRTRVLAGK